MTEQSNTPETQSELNETSQPVYFMQKTSTTKMVSTLGIVAMLSGLLVVLTWQLTLEPISENQRIMTEKAIFQVIPGAEYRRTYFLTDNNELQLEDYGQPIENKANSLKFYAAFDRKNQLKGIATEGAAQGYADMVRLLFGYDPVCECIRGFSIIKMAETPGLGDKILTDKKFLANFKALDASLNHGRTALKHNIVSVKHGSKQNPWEIDAISGATITSKAVARAIDQSSGRLLPRLSAQLDQLKLLNLSHPPQGLVNSADGSNTSKQE